MGLLSFSARMWLTFFTLVLSMWTALFTQNAIAGSVVPTFSKQFTPATIAPTNISTLTFEVNNTTSSPVTGVNFTDMLPAGMTVANPANAVSLCINAIVTAVPGTNVISVTDGRLAAFSRCTIEVNVTVNAPGVYMNVTGDLISSAGNSGTASADLTAATDRPIFTKSFIPNPVNFGDRTRLTFTLDNTLNASNVVSTIFTDTLPPGMVIADPPNLVDTCNTGIITAIPGTAEINSSFPNIPAVLLSGNTCTISLDVHAEGLGLLENTTSDFTSSSGFMTLSSGRSGDVLSVNPSSEVQLIKRFLDDPVLPGDTVELEFEIMNRHRSFTADSISFSDDLNNVLAGLQAIGLPQQDICGPGSMLSGTSNLTFSGGSLSPEQVCRFSVTLQTPAAALAGIYTNVTSPVTADLAGLPIVATSTNDDLFISDAPTLSKAFLLSPVGAGEMTTLEYTITNNSSTSAVSDISFTDELDTFIPGIAVDSALPLMNFCGAGSSGNLILVTGERFIQFFGGSLAAGDSCTFSINLRPVMGTPANDYTSTSTNIQSMVGGIAREGRSASASLSVLQAPELSMQFAEQVVAPGDVVSLAFTISVDSESTAAATDISFSADLNAALPGLSAVGLPINDICGVGSQLSGTTNLTFTGGSLNPGESCTFMADVQIPAAAPTGTVLALTSPVTAMVNGSSVTGTPTQDDLIVTSLSFTKQYIDGPYVAGQMGTLRFTIDNSTNLDDASGLFFIDSIAAAISGHVAIGLPINDICGAGSQISGAGTILFVGGNLLAGETCQFDVQVLIPAFANSGDYTNVTSTLNGTINGVAFTLPPAVDILQVNNDVLLLEKAFSSETAIIGSTVGLSFTLNNSSNALVDSISFSDNLAAAIPMASAIGLPLNDVCGAGSTLSGTGLLSLSGASLAPGESCVINIDVNIDSSTPAGAYINTTSAVSGMLSGLPVSGAAASDELLVSNIRFNKSFSGPVITGQTTTLTYTINNDDSVNAVSGLRFTDDLDSVVTGLTAVGLSSSDICGLGSTLSGTSLIVFDQGVLPPSGSCSFDVTIMVPFGLTGMTPTSISSALLSNGAVVSSPAIADLMVLGQADIAVTPATVDFGDIRLGVNSMSMSVNVQNTGTADLNVTNLDVAAAPFNLTGGSCGNTPFIVPIAGSCTLDYNFTPTAVGLTTQTIMLTSDGLSGPQTFELRGTGIEPVVNLSLVNIDFGIVQVNTVSAPMMLTLSNIGTADLSISAIDSPAAPFAQSVGSCTPAPFVLAPAASCTLAYEFAPTSIGVFSETISINSDASSSPDNFQLMGQSGDAGIVLSNSMIDIGAAPLGGTRDAILSISNTGIVDLVITDLQGPSTPFSVSDVDCGPLPIQIMPASACDLLLSFQPTQIGEATDNLSIVSNDPNSPEMVQVTGFGFLLLEVPTLQQKALIAMALVLLMFGVWQLRRAY